MTFAHFCRDIFLLAQFGVDAKGPARGSRWEARVAEYLAARGAPTESLPGGSHVWGHVSMSGLAHQIDGSLGCSDGLVIAEWKAHRGPVPKNEILRFKAGTDDYFMALSGSLPKRPVVRVFGGIGRTSDATRSYAAVHGIALIEPDRWPAATLATMAADWPDPTGTGPSERDRSTLSWLCRPVQQVLAPHRGGGFLVPAPPAASTIQAALRLQDYWSDRAWEVFDARPGSFESLVARVHPGQAAA